MEALYPLTDPRYDVPTNGRPAGAIAKLPPLEGASRVAWHGAAGGRTRTGRQQRVDRRRGSHDGRKSRARERSAPRHRHPRHLVGRRSERAGIAHRRRGARRHAGRDARAQRARRVGRDGGRNRGDARGQGTPVGCGHGSGKWAVGSPRSSPRTDRRAFRRRRRRRRDADGARRRDPRRRAERLRVSDGLAHAPQSGVAARAVRENDARAQCGRRRRGDARSAGARAQRARRRRRGARDLSLRRPSSARTVVGPLGARRRYAGARVSAVRERAARRSVALGARRHQQQPLRRNRFAASRAVVAAAVSRVRDRTRAGRSRRCAR